MTAVASPGRHKVARHRGLGCSDHVSLLMLTTSTHHHEDTLDGEHKITPATFGERTPPLAVSNADHPRSSAAPSEMSDCSDDDEDIRQLNEQSDATHAQTDNAAKRTLSQRQAAWGFFVAYFTSIKHDKILLRELPGAPDEPEFYLSASNPDLDYRTCAAFMTHFISGATGLVTTLPSHRYVTSIWNSFCRYVEVERHKPIDQRVRLEISVHLGELLDQGVISATKTEKVFTDGKGLLSMVRSTLAYDCPIRQSRDRLQILFWMALHAQTAQRVGSGLPDNAQPDSRVMQYRDFDIHVCGNESPGKPNVIVVSYLAPNRKTDTTQHQSHTLIPQPYLGLCPVFLFLTLATIDGALPHSLEQLLDPAILDNKAEIHLSMRDSSKFDTPMKSAGPRGHWTVNIIGRFLRIVSRHAKFPRTLTTHSFRRMAALFMRAAGEAYEKIQRKLGHIEGSNVTMSYVKFIPACDVASLLFEIDERCNELLVLHPDCLRPSQLQDMKLDRDAIERVFTHPDVEDAQGLLEEARKTVANKYGTPYSKVPPEGKAILHQAWGRLRYRIDQLTAYEQSMKIWQHDQVAPKPETPAFTDSQESAAENDSSVNILPASGENVNFDGHACEYILSNFVADAEPASATAGADDMEEDDEGQMAGSQSADVALGSCIASVRQVAQSEETANEDINGLNDLEAFQRLALTGSRTPDWIQASLAWLKIPDLVSSICLFRPAHRLLDGNCDQCSQHLPTLLPRKSETALEKQRQTLNFHRHLMDCHGSAAMQEVATDLLAKYPSRIPTTTLPITLTSYVMGHLCKGYTRRDGSYRPPDSTKDLLSTAGLSGSFYRQIEDKGEYATCEQCHVVLSSYSLLRTHLLVRHGIWLFPSPQTLKSEKTNMLERIRTGEWDIGLASFPTKFYFFPDATYLPDPADYERRASEYIGDILMARSKVSRWTVRPDVKLRPGSLKEDLAPGDAYDTYLRWENGRLAKAIQSGICFFCFWDPSTCATEAIRDWRDCSPDFKDHQLRHMSDVLLEIWDDVFASDTGSAANASSSTAGPKPIHHYLVNEDGQLACPDTICRFSGRWHPNGLDFVDHLVAVHHLQLAGPTYFNNQQLDIIDLSFKDNATLENLVRRGVHTLKGDRRDERRGGEKKEKSETLKHRKGQALGRREVRQKWGEAQLLGFPALVKKRKKNKPGSKAGHNKKKKVEPEPQDQTDE